MTGTSILYIPDVAMEKIFSFLSYDEIAKNRLVCTKFNEVGGRMLSRGFIQVEKRHAAIYKRVKSLLPRRESERKIHPLARHCDILQGVETRLSMLNMTYMKYIDSNLLCFIPGKVLDEIINVLHFAESDNTPPRTQRLLQEMRDLSSMAMEHFDEHILPHKNQFDEKRQSLLASFSGSRTTQFRQTKSFVNQQSSDLQKIKKQYKTYKRHIAYLNQNTQTLILKIKKQNKRLKAQSIKIRDQDRKIQEQSNKIQEQDTTLNEIKKHMDEWDQKYKDLTTEIVRARDYILLKASPQKSNNSTVLPSTQTPTTRHFKPHVRPRVSRFLLQNYTNLHLDLDRKRKSNLLPEIPVKVSRSLDPDEEGTPSIDKLMPLKDPDKISTDEGRKGALNFSLEMLMAPLTAITSRKRKIAEQLDLTKL